MCPLICVPAHGRLEPQRKAFACRPPHLSEVKRLLTSAQLKLVEKSIFYSPHKYYRLPVHHCGTSTIQPHTSPQHPEFIEMVSLE